LHDFSLGEIEVSLQSSNLLVSADDTFILSVNLSEILQEVREETQFVSDQTLVLSKELVQFTLKLRDLRAPFVLEPNIGDLCLYLFFDLRDFNCLAILLLDLLHQLFGKLSNDNAFRAFLLLFYAPADHCNFGLPALHNVVELFLHALAPSLAILNADF